MTSSRSKPSEFSPSSKPTSTEKTRSKDVPVKSSRIISLFGDSKSEDDDSDIFKPIIEKKSNVPQDKNLVKEGQKKSLIFEDSDDEDDLFASVKLPSANKTKNIFSDGPDLFAPKLAAVPQKKSLSSSIFDDSDEEEEKSDLFGKKMLEESLDTAIPAPESKPKKGIFDDEDEDEDDDLFGDRGKKSASLFAEIKKKLEKLPVKEPQEKPQAKAKVEEAKTDVQDGATVSKGSEPPKSLNLARKVTPPAVPSPTLSSPEGEDKQMAQAPKKAVSGKIKNLMGKMGDLKILSPTDSPPVFKKNSVEDKKVKGEKTSPVEKKSDSSGSQSGGSSPISKYLQKFNIRWVEI